MTFQRTVVVVALVALAAMCTPLAHFSVKQSWSYTPPSNWVVQHYAMNDAALFLVVSGPTSTNGTIVALDPVHGHTFWETSLDTIGCSTYYGNWLTIFADDASVVVNCATNCNDCAFVGLVPTTGHVRWRIPVASTSELFNGVLSDGVFFAPYYASMGTPCVFGAVRATDGVLLWQLAPMSWPEATLAPNKQVLVLLPPSGAMVAVNASNGKAMWNRTHSGSNGVWGVNGLVLYSTPSRLLAVAANTNVTVWALTFNASFWLNQIIPVGDAAVVVAGNTFVVAVAVHSGDALYVVTPAQTAFSGAAVSDGRLLVTDTAGYIAVVNASTGVHLTNISFPCSSEFQGCQFRGQFASIARGAVYTAAQASSGYQYALTAYNATTGGVLGSPVPPILLGGGYDVQTFGATAVFIKSYASVVVAVVGEAGA